MFFRAMQNGVKLHYSTAVQWIHIEHTRIGDFYDEKKTQTNREMMDDLFQTYEIMKFAVIEKNDEGKRILKPIKFS